MQQGTVVPTPLAGFKIFLKWDSINIQQRISLYLYIKYMFTRSLPAGEVMK